jgi:hypothetical protein
MGFERVYVPEVSLKNEKIRGTSDGKNIEIIGVRSIANMDRLGVW